MSPGANGWSFDPGLTANRPWPSDLADPSDAVRSAREDWNDSRRPFITELFGIALELVARGRQGEARELLAAPWPGDEETDVVESVLLLRTPSGKPLEYRPDPASRQELLDRVISLSRFHEELRNLDSPTDDR